MRIARVSLAVFPTSLSRVYRASFRQALSHRNLETESVIEEALEQLEELEDDYKSFMTELNNSSNSKLIINAMIKNYQKRLEILENVLNRIEQIKNTKTLNNEIYL